MRRITLSLKEAADRLGVSRESVRQAFLRGDIPGARVGRRIVIQRQAIDELVRGPKPVPASGDLFEPTPPAQRPSRGETNSSKCLGVSPGTPLRDLPMHPTFPCRVEASSPSMKLASSGSGPATPIYRGTPVYLIREELLDELLDAAAWLKANTLEYSTWTVSDFVEVAIEEKLAQLTRRYGAHRFPKRPDPGSPAA